MRKLGLPRYYGSKLGKLVKVIAVDDLHSWSELHKSTMFTDRELNYYIAQLFNDKVLYKRNKQYFIDSNLANEYKEYYNCRAVKPETKQYNEKIRQENLAEKEEILKTSGRNQKIVVRPQIYIAILIGFALVTGLIYANNTNGFFNSQLPTPKPNPESIPDLPSEPSTTEPDSDTPIPSPETETEPQSEPETPPTPETPHEESNPESETPPESNPEPPSEPDDTPTIPKTPPQEPESKPQPSPEPKSTIQISIIAKCTKIYDGDTFEISNGEVIRLADIDCPEANETGYESSKNALIDLIYSKTVYLDLDDKHGTTMEGQGDRYVCVVYLKDGSNINLKLLKSGYASYDDHDNEFNPILGVMTIT